MPLCSYPFRPRASNLATSLRRAPRGMRSGLTIAPPDRVIAGSLLWPSSTRRRRGQRARRQSRQPSLGCPDGVALWDRARVVSARFGARHGKPFAEALPPVIGALAFNCRAFTRRIEAERCERRMRFSTRFSLARLAASHSGRIASKIRRMLAFQCRHVGAWARQMPRNS